LGKITADPTPKSPAFPFIDNSFAEKHQNVNQGRLCNSLNLGLSVFVKAG
jgi:hypothetical protein